MADEELRPMNPDQLTTYIRQRNGLDDNTPSGYAPLRSTPYAGGDMPPEDELAETMAVNDPRYFLRAERTDRDAKEQTRRQKQAMGLPTPPFPEETSTEMQQDFPAGDFLDLENGIAQYSGHVVELKPQMLRTVKAILASAVATKLQAEVLKLQRATRAMQPTRRKRKSVSAVGGPGRKTVPKAPKVEAGTAA